MHTRILQQSGHRARNHREGNRHINTEGGVIMFVHIYRQNESDSDGLHQSTTRVTFRQEFHFGSVYEPCIVLGTLPHVTVIKMKDIRWYWIEEN